MAYILMFLMLFTGSAMAGNCIVDKDNNVVAKISYAPNIKDLESRGDAVVKCADDIVIGDADFRNNKVVKHVKTKKELDAISQIENDKQSKKLKRKSAEDKLKALGLTDDELNALIGE
jgi:hypothetical protein